MKYLLTVLFAAGALVGAPAAVAFGDMGHAIVAEIAARNLEPAARAEVERLLGDRASNAMREWSSWPDETRELPPFDALSPLHYINFKQGCRYDRKRDCRDGRCVVAALQGFVEALETSRDDHVRAEALRWVIHLVGDVHQPLHASPHDDKGGNDAQTQFRGKGVNLHKLWDSTMLETRERNAVRYADKLMAPRAQLEASAWSVDAPARWAEESCRVAETVAYPYGKRIDDAYVSRSVAALETRLRQAGFRLADVLNRTLSRAPR